MQENLDKRLNGKIVAALLFQNEEKQHEPETVSPRCLKTREGSTNDQTFYSGRGRTDAGGVWPAGQPHRPGVIAVLTLLGRKVQTVFNVAQNALTTS
jgi:hypothetical protein